MYEGSRSTTLRVILVRYIAIGKFRCREEISNIVQTRVTVSGMRRHYILYRRLTYEVQTLLCIVPRRCKQQM